MKVNYFKSIFDINFSLYPEVKVIIFDIDNTLTSNKMRHPSDDVKNFINKLKEQGYIIYLYSNNIMPRIVKFATELKVRYFYRAKKPIAKDLKFFIKYNNYKPNEILFIGDQVFTDVFCGLQCKVNMILVDPIANDEGIFLKIRRIFEIPFRENIKKKELKI